MTPGAISASSSLPNSGSVAPKDADAMLELLGKVAAMPESLLERRYELLNRLSRLVRADIWVWVCLHVPQTGLPVNSNAVDGGWTDEAERTRMYAAVNTPDCHALSTLLAKQARQLGRSLTIIAEQIAFPVPVVQAHRRFCDSVDIASRMLSIYPRTDPPGDYGLFTLSRRRGSPPFTERDRAIIHSLLSHAPWVHQLDSEMSRHADPLLRLTRRERQILRLSMVGHGRKKIADLLGVTLYTVTDHFKSMYRKLGVRSQGELLSKFISGKLE